MALKLFLKLILLLLLFSVDLLANNYYIGSAKQDVNVRLNPNYESKVAYVLRKNQAVNIYSIIKTKNKGTWYKIDNGYVVMRFISTNEQNIPVETFPLSLVNENIKTQETEANNNINETVDENKEEILQKSDVVIQNIQELKEEEITSQLKPMVEKNDEINDSQLIDNTTKIEQKNIIEPVIIKKEESFISKYINFEYVFYGLIAIIVLIIIIILVVKIFSRPSIADQISQHQKRSADLKKALSNSNDK